MYVQKDREEKERMNFSESNARCKKEEALHAKREEEAKKEKEGMMGKALVAAVVAGAGKFCTPTPYKSGMSFVRAVVC